MLKSSLIFLLTAATCLAEEPPLPLGLGSDEPALPAGLSGEAPALPEGLGGDEPSLPVGLGEPPASPGETAIPEANSPGPIRWDLNGFAELRAGAWTQENPVEPEASLAELRWQLDLSAHYKSTSGQATVDLIGDAFSDERSIDLRRGKGWMDVRELWISSPLSDRIDLKAGRQVNTWGTGDYLFINDLFPKDWQSFLLGRDDEYLKAPGNALRLNYYSEPANLDIVYTPRFAPDRYISGERLSYYSDATGVIGGEDQEVRTELPDSGEIAARLHRLIGSTEVALYAYHGYWKSPAGQNTKGKAIFPRLTVGGASALKPIAGGIAKAEFGYYYSGDDSGGDDPLIRNSEYRFLVGYEHELASELTGSFQWYVEHMDHYDDYLDTLPEGAAARDETRHLLTVQLTKLLMMQDLRLSIFVFYSPTDEDTYLRPNLLYKINDQWQSTVGANVFFGEHKHTFFGQFENNTNVYFSLRRSF
ncbi:hypothetical protein [Coraliomargarita parva]|uniref:hypothetical protein n=1 Tax=Coraliomargarita parva TaxID=3014050 RepID=UPI0022B48484|nr:hypothetical protein [Coraliomargarita parva]